MPLVVARASRCCAQTPRQRSALAAASTPAAETPSPVPSAESWLTGSIDVGYRWRTDVGGSFDTYRSIVNLGSGPKLLGTDFTLTDPQHRAFDQIRVRANSWGDEPYQTFHLDAKKSKLYDFSADYRDMAYFDFLPSYADPLLGPGHRAQRAILRHAPPSCAASSSICCRATGSSPISPTIGIPARAHGATAFVTRLQ